MYRSLIIGALALAAVPALAAAPEKPADKPHVFTQLFMSPAGEPFRAFPEDPYPSEAWFRRADANGDGVITLEEFKADALIFFKKLDLNGDGYIDDAENRNFEKNIAPEILEAVEEAFDPEKAPRQPKFEKNPDGSYPTVESNGSRISDDRMQRTHSVGEVLQMRRGAGRFSFLNEPQPVRASDANLDFRISQKEWLDAAARRFSALDLDHDGKLERSELPVTPFQMKLRIENAMLKKKTKK